MRIRAGHRTADEHVDNLRPPVKLNLSLKGAQDPARRAADNQAALGGMKKPRISNHRIPNQRKVGKRVAHAIDSFLDLHPDVQLRVLNSIGVAKDSVTPPLQTGSGSASQDRRGSLGHPEAHASQYSHGTL